MVTTVEAIADLKLMVNDPQGPLPVGKEVVYEIVITNRGTREANNIDVGDTVLRRHRTVDSHRPPCGNRARAG